MKHVNLLDHFPLESLNQQLSECAKSLGGKNIFLQLLESREEAVPHPLIDKQCEFRFARGSIKWSKPIFKEKLKLLNLVRLNSADGNLFPQKGIKGYKSMLNLLRTLNPITFEVQPKNRKDGHGFRFRPFDLINDKTTKINPIFEAVFFTRVTQIKKILNPKNNRSYNHE